MIDRILIRSSLVITMIALTIFTLFAQAPSKIEHYSTEDGLSHDIITCMFKDQEGYMWFGTWDGINRFDGYSFKTFKSVPGDRLELKNNRIDQILEDGRGHLWLKSYDGQVYRFDKATEKFASLTELLRLKQKINFDRILACDADMLWISTVNDGILCVPAPGYLNKSYQLYSKNGPKALRLPSNHLGFFFRDGSDTWIGTDKGLAYLTKTKAGDSKITTLDLAETATANFTAVSGDDNNMYFGTSGGRLLTFGKRTRTFTSTVSVTAGRLNSLLPSRNGDQVYITTSSGELIIFDIRSQTPIRFLFNRAAPLHSIYEDHTGSLWLEPDRSGVVRFDLITKKFQQFTQNTDAQFNNPGNHFKVFEDRNKTTWCVLRDGGFGYFDPAGRQFKYFFNEPGSRGQRFSNIVTVAFYDPTGVLWLHTDERGLEKVIFEPNNFKQNLLVDPGKFKSDNEVRSLFYDRQRRLWIGAKSGKLYVFRDGKEISDIFVNLPPGGLGSVYTIIQDHSGRLWLGTKANGLYRADPVANGKFRLTPFRNDGHTPGSMWSNEIYSLVEDSKGRIWIGTFDNGLGFYQEKNDSYPFIRVNGRYGYPRRFYKIRHMSMDGAGKLWIGTTDGLVVVQIMDSHFTFRTYSKIPGDPFSLGNNDIQFIYRDSQGRMWLSTSGGGLNLALGDAERNQMKFKSYTTRNGLANDYILSCAEDDANNLWLATKSSLSKFSIEAGTFKNYNSYDGVPNTTFSEATCQHINDGRMVFGTIHGYLSFDPRQLKDLPIKTNMVFTSLQINNTEVDAQRSQGILEQSINYTPALNLKYNQNIISIDYAVLDYRSGNRQSYQHRLVGFDTAWQDNKNQRRATYTNLPPGHYVFQVRCLNADRYQNIPYKQLAITIHPPFWRTWWAYLLYVVLAGIVFEAIRRTGLTMLRLRQKIAIEQQLTELKLSFFTNISHELRTPLTLILNPVAEILKEEKLSEQGREYFSIIRRNANRMARFVNQLLDLRKVQSKKARLNLARIELIAFITEIGAYFKELSREKHIAFEVLSDACEINGWFDPEKIETILYNLVSNSYKFTPPGSKITVRVQTTPLQDEVLIEVNDQGSGVPESELPHIFELYYEAEHLQARNLKGTGIGLALAKELVDLHRGKISAANRPSGGLSVSVILPLHVDYVGHPPPETALPEPAYLNEEDTDGETTDTPENHDPGLSAPLLLLVEDNSDMRAFLSRQLSSFYRMTVAENGAIGLEMAKKFQPDLILSDIMMPVMDGIEMLEQLKKNDLTSHIPVILLSAKSAIENQIRGLQYGADYYITKPFENDFLIAAVTNILEKRKRFAKQIVDGKKTMELGPNEIVVTSKDELFLRQVIAVIEERMMDRDFTIETVADVIHMARATFFRKFKSLTQLAPVEFVRDIRLKRAKQLIDGGGGNIKEIAYEVGFSSAKYFSTCFKTKYLMSPSEYQKKTDKT